MAPSFASLVAVILDLSYGAYYACILPQDIPYDTLEEFVLRQTTYSEVENLVHIGANPVPHTAGVPLHLQNGDVITFRRPPQVWHARQSVEALFADRGRWGPIHDMPSPISTSGLLVQHGLERVFLPAHHHYGQTPLEAICTAWDYEPGQCTICAFPTPTVEFRGNSCSHVVCVMPFSSRQLRGHSNCRRRDVFALCDFRGIGFGVRVAHSHVYEFHIPSTAAIFGCSLDPSKHLVVVGRPDTESDVPVTGHTVFTVRAVANDSLASDDLLEGGSPPGHDESEDEDALPTSELVARLWPSAVAARGRDATLTTVGRLSRRRSRSRSRPKQQLSFAVGAKVGSAEDGISRACLVHDAPLLPPFGSRDACQVLPDISGAAVGDLDSLKLLQEPTSHSFPDRDRVEHAREFLEGEGRLWPYVPATDQFAVQRAAERDQTTDAASTDGESDFTFFLHKLDFVPETVVLSLVPPIEVYDALEQLQDVRDQAHRHLYPSLVVADPQPHQGSGVVLALPAWVEHDTVVFFDLAEYDGRQFASSAPAMASKAVLLQMCEVEHDRADVYIGNSNVPLAEETVPLWTGVCVFVVQRHLLPGPYFYLPDILLDAALWDDTPAIPIGPAGGYFCAVGETGHRRVPVETSTPLIDRRELAAWFGFDPATMLTQPAVPVIADVSINGFFCRNVCAVSEPFDPATGEPAAGLLLAFIDCRALLQGWMLLATTTGYVSRREVEILLTTFMPRGWSLHLEGLPEQAEQCPVVPGQVITASFVPAESEESAEEGDDPEDRGDNDIAIEDVPMIGDDLLSSPRSAARAIDSATSGSTQRSRSPHRSLVDCLSQSAGPVRPGETSWGVPCSPWSHVSSAIRLFLASRHSLRSKWVVTGAYAGSISGTISGGLSFAHFVNGHHAGPGLFSEGSAAAGLDFTGPVRHGTGQDRPTNDARTDVSATAPPAAPIAVADSSGGGIVSEELDTADVGSSGLHQETLSSPSFLYGSFYLLGQDCTAEWIAVRLPLAVAVADATPLIQAARYPHHAERFPSLVPVRPQPWQQAALYVAMPVWEFAGVLVAFDLSGIDGGVFSLAVPGRVTRRTLLLAAELDEYANHAVFVRTMPWPIPDEFPIELAHGDLIQVVPAGVIATFRSDLAAMLRTADGWDPDWLIPGDYAERAWVIADDRHLCFTVAPTRRRHFRQDLAEVLAVPARQLLLRPAQEPLTDHAFRGQLVRHLYVATGLPTVPSVARCPICFLDLRPILLGFSWYYVPEGILTRLRVHDRFSPRIPEGYALGFSKAGSPIGPFDRPLQVSDGDVVAIHFYIPPPADLSSSDSDQGGPGPGGRASEGDSSGPPSVSTPGPTEASTTTIVSRHSDGHDAGTGGSRRHDGLRASCGPVRTACAAMWNCPGDTSGFYVCFLRQLLAVLATTGAALSVMGNFILRRPPTFFVVLSYVALGRAVAAAGRTCAPSGAPVLNIARAGGRGERRPLPTPCRARVLQRTVGARPPSPLPEQFGSNTSAAALTQDTGQLRTLLEVSRDESPVDPLFLAWTLLEALEEHLYARCPSTLNGQGLCAHAPASHDGTLSVPVSLSAALPKHVSYDLSEASMYMPFVIDEVQKVLRATWELTLDVPSDVHWHPAAAAAMQACTRSGVRDTVDLHSIEVYTDGSYNGDTSSWSFVAVGHTTDSTVFLGCAGGLVLIEQGPFWIGADSHSVLHGESSALFWAIAWTLQFGDSVPCAIWTDSTTASGQASGKSGAAVNAKLAHACRSLGYVAEAIGGVKVQDFCHVRAHQGHAWNEAADALAKHSHWFATAIPSIFATFTLWIADASLEWMWLYVAATRRPSAWPTVRGNVFADANRGAIVGEAFCPAERLFQTGHSRTVGSRPKRGFSFALRLLTVNVQTLEDGQGEGVCGKVRYVREQLEGCAAVVVGLQETRAKNTSTCISETHCRYISACDSKGNGGVELWFSRTHPFAWDGDCPLFFHNNDFRALAWDSRSLFVRFVRGTVRIVFVTVHVLSATHPDRVQWWTTFRNKLHACAQGDRVVVLGDYNTRFEESVPARIGELVWETQQDVPSPLMEVLHRHDLWLPSTYSACHEGPSHTWVSPGGTATSRIDYIAIPTSWFVGAQGSYVLYDVDFGQTGLDHYAVALDCSFVLEAFVSSGCKTPSCDVFQLSRPEAHEKVREICQGAPLLPWNLDVHTHYEILADYLRERLAATFPARRARCRRTFFSATTWELRQQRVWLRKRLHTGAHLVRTIELQCAFTSLQQHCDFGSLLLKLVATCLSGLADFRHHLRELRAVKPLLKRAIAGDRGRYLHEVAVAAVRNPTKDVISKLRPLLGPPKRHRRGTSALPVVELEDGSVAGDHAQAQARWVRHFSSLEDGGPTTPSALINACRARQADRDLSDLSLDHKVVPTRALLEDCLRRSPTGKAQGNDQIPADLLHLQANSLSLPLFQVALKASFRLAEPIQWKGGSLFVIWKRKGSMSQCESFRGILVSSATGKAFHSALRRKAAPSLDVAAGSLQIGGRPGFPVQLANHTVRAFQSYCIQQGLSCAIVFLDLKEAFHRVARPLLVGGPLDDGHVAGMKTLHFPADAFSRLQDYVRDAPIFGASGADPWLSGMLSEVLCDTWFTWERSTSLAQVRGGTRPGDNLADLLFSFLFSEVLARIRARLSDLDLQCRFAWHEAWSGQLSSDCSGLGATQSPVDVTWMDDCALLYFSASAAAVLEGTRRIAAIMLDECIRAILTPNLGPGKSETVVSLQGKGARALRIQAFAGNGPSLDIPSTMLPGSRLRVVPKYCHLGGIIHHTGAVRSEVKARVGHAWTSFRQHQRRVFGSAFVTPHDKAVIFESIVLSTLVFAAGTWTVDRAEAIAPIQHALLQMSRIMLKPRYSFAQACHLPPAFVLSCAGVPSAMILLHSERLRHLALLVRLAPSELWAILHAEMHWLQLAQESVRWLLAQLARSGLRDRPNCWEECLGTVRKFPGKWKSWIRRARCAAMLDERWQAEVQLFHGHILRQLTSLGAHPSLTVQAASSVVEVCAMCGQGFKDLRAWSHHTFKRHGRIRPERRLADGCQCPVCLKTYASNGRLCNHLRHSRACRDALSSTDIVVQPQPGHGSKRFDCGADCLVPPMQAAGPSRQWTSVPVTPEPEMPSETVLCRLEDILCHSADSCASYCALLELLRAAFCAECLQRSRLVATAAAWRSALDKHFEQDEDWLVQWASWHARAAAFLTRTDLVDWIAPEAFPGVTGPSTFRDASTVLPWLETGSVLLPAWHGSRIEVSRAFVGDSDLSAFSSGTSVCRRSACIQDPSLLDFHRYGEATDAGVTYCDTRGLLSSLQPPRVLRSYVGLEPDLHRLRLFGDLVRGTLHLWSLGHGAILAVSGVDCPALCAIAAVAPFKANREDRLLLANCPLATAPSFLVSP